MPLDTSQADIADLLQHFSGVLQGSLVSAHAGGRAGFEAVQRLAAKIEGMQERIDELETTVAALRRPSVCEPERE